MAEETQDVSALQKQVAELTKQLDDKDKALAELSTQFAEKESELQKTYQVNESLSLEIEKLTAVANSVNALPAPKGKIILSDYGFESGGKRYGFRYAAMTIGKQKITPVEVVADETLQKKLIDTNSGMIYVK